MIRSWPLSGTKSYQSNWEKISHFPRKLISSIYTRPKFPNITIIVMTTISVSNWQNLAIYLSIHQHFICIGYLQKARKNLTKWPEKVKLIEVCPWNGTPNFAQRKREDRSDKGREINRKKDVDLGGFRYGYQYYLRL